MATTYILRCADNKLYVGSTTNIDERLKRHNAGYASEYTHLHRPVELVYKEEYDTYQEAFRRERQLKKWTLAKKEALIAGDIEKLKELSKSKISPLLILESRIQRASCSSKVSLLPYFSTILIIS